MRPWEGSLGGAGRGADLTLGELGWSLGARSRGIRRGAIGLVLGGRKGTVV